MLFGDSAKVGYKVGYKVVYNAPGWCIVGGPKHHKETGKMVQYADTQMVVIMVLVTAIAGFGLPLLIIWLSEEAYKADHKSDGDTTP